MNDLKKYSFADLVAMQDEKSKFAVGLLLLDIDDEIGKRLNKHLVNRVPKT